jgi:hypothetical protein
VVLHSIASTVVVMLGYIDNFPLSSYFGNVSGGNYNIRENPSQTTVKVI